MPISEYPFVKLFSPDPRPFINIGIEKDNFQYPITALIDTGSTETYIPLGIAQALRGQRYYTSANKVVPPKNATGQSLPGDFWDDNFILNILTADLNYYHMHTLRTRNVKVASNFKKYAILGQDSFLSDFVLTVNYSRGALALRHPARSIWPLIRRCSICKHH